MLNMSNPLITDRRPLILIERARVLCHDGSVLVKKDDAIVNLPVRQIHLLMLGNGTSITSEAMYLCAKANCFIAQSKGGLSCHSVFHAGLYSNAEKIVDQVVRSRCKKTRLIIAKRIAVGKLKTLDLYSDEIFNKVLKANDIPTILGIEGSITKKEYKHLYGKEFSRDGRTFGHINKNINILNSIFYSFTATIIVALGYSPSIGFLHGHTRRGALTFDVVDIFKHRLYLKNIELLNSNKNMARELSSILMKNDNRAVREIISEIQSLCSGEK